MENEYFVDESKRRVWRDSESYDTHVIDIVTCCVRAQGLAIASYLSAIVDLIVKNQVVELFLQPRESLARRCVFVTMRLT